MQSFQLIIKTGPNPGKVYLLDKEQMVIGRDSLSDVMIADSEVSRRHARLYLQGGGYVLEDLGSTNGCFINGQRLSQPQPLRPGDMVMLGEKISLKYEVIQSDPEATIASMPSFAPPPPRPDNFPASTPAAAAAPPPPPPPPAFAPAVEAPVYSNQIPAGPDEALPAAPAAKNSNRTWLLAGCGCLLLLVCGCGALAWGFDAMQLYCQPPFDGLFGMLGFCTP